jgi:hypothetical protein
VFRHSEPGYERRFDGDRRSRRQPRADGAAMQKMIEAGRLRARKIGREYLIEPGALGSIPKQAAGRPPKDKIKAAKKSGSSGR